jgi:hypothetical protein
MYALAPQAFLLGQAVMQVSCQILQFSILAIISTDEINALDSVSVDYKFETDIIFTVTLVPMLSFPLSAPVAV